jgi:hypothetical protein
VSCPVGNGLGSVDLEFGIGTDTDQALVKFETRLPR